MNETMKRLYAAALKISSYFSDAGLPAGKDDDGNSTCNHWSGCKDTMSLSGPEETTILSLCLNFGPTPSLIGVMGYIWPNGNLHGIAMDPLRVWKKIRNLFMSEDLVRILDDTGWEGPVEFKNEECPALYQGIRVENSFGSGISDDMTFVREVKEGNVLLSYAYGPGRETRYHIVGFYK